MLRFTVVVIKCATGPGHQKKVIFRKFNDYGGRKVKKFSARGHQEVSQGSPFTRGSARGGHRETVMFKNAMTTGDNGRTVVS